MAPISLSFATHFSASSFGTLSFRIDGSLSVSALVCAILERERAKYNQHEVLQNKILKKCERVVARTKVVTSAKFIPGRSTRISFKILIFALSSNLTSFRLNASFFFSSGLAAGAVCKWDQRHRSNKKSHRCSGKIPAAPAPAPAAPGAPGAAAA